MGGLHTQRSIFNDDALVGFLLGLVHRLEEGLRIGFALAHVMPSDFDIAEQFGEIPLDALKQGVLLRAGNEDIHYTGFLQRLEHTDGTRHDGRLAQFPEIAGLHTIEGMGLVIGDVLTGTRLELHLNDFTTRHSFKFIELVTGTLDTIFLHQFHPSLGVVLHRVIEHAVAVDECGADVEAFVTCVLQVLGDGLL